MFTVIDLTTGDIVHSGISNGQQAAAIAAALTASTGRKHQPRRDLKAASNVDWRLREARRFDDGTYTRLPWTWCWWFHIPGTSQHYAHVSMDDPGKIAFTADEAQGIADKQTRMKPGRYLRQFYSRHISEGDIRDYARQFAGMYDPVVLRFAATADEIEVVYVIGPRSCMSYEADHFDSPIHPARMYACGDLQVAYLQMSEDDEDQQITARAVVWPERKIYSTIYGDADRLEPALEREGYREGQLSGARLTRHEHDGCFVVPYVDGVYRAADHGTHLVIDRLGGISCETTTGLSPRRYECDSCGDTVSMGNEIDDMVFCNQCYENETFWCSYRDERMTGESVIMANGETWSLDAFEDHGFTCEGSGENYPDDDGVTLADGTRWSQDYFNEHGAECEKCAGDFPAEDVREQSNGEKLCEGCADDVEAVDAAEVEAVS